MSTGSTTTQCRLLRQHIRDLSLACRNQRLFNSRWCTGGALANLRTFIAPLAAQNDRDHFVLRPNADADQSQCWYSRLIGN